MRPILNGTEVTVGSPISKERTLCDMATNVAILIAVQAAVCSWSLDCENSLSALSGPVSGFLCCEALLLERDVPFEDGVTWEQQKIQNMVTVMHLICCIMG